jgi:hypothetical protein
MKKYIKTPVIKGKSLCPICQTLNSHLTGKHCGHLFKITVKDIAFYLARDIERDAQDIANVLARIGAQASLEQAERMLNRFDKLSAESPVYRLAKVDFKELGD